MTVIDNSQTGNRLVLDERVQAVTILGIDGMVAI
jgi:hypothetical protein